MKETSPTLPCILCGLDTPAAAPQEPTICPGCSPVARAVRNNPEAIKALWRHYQDEPILPRPQSSMIDAEGELPEVLDGKRYRAMDREFNKWYLSVSEIEGKPVEIFASTAFDRDHQLQSRISNLTTITRLISMILRHVVLGERLTLNKCLTQIQRSSRQQDDLPDLLYRVLSKYNLPS
ncbi:TSCPD domain-containing protein [Desulfogranum mediterraneum]|uniref:TSCPD domain-containing protein n=1 Tax=Desulfogranum mediterraneum TaxID=160661 RepID=UPI0003FDC7E7|nr:hypothetical protein [Desulfogranum mediterraneum]